MVCTCTATKLAAICVVVWLVVGPTNVRAFILLRTRSACNTTSELPCSRTPLPEPPPGPTWKYIESRCSKGPRWKTAPWWRGGGVVGRAREAFGGAIANSMANRPLCPQMSGPLLMNGTYRTVRPQLKRAEGPLLGRPRRKGGPATGIPDICSYCKEVFTGNSSYNPEQSPIPNICMWRTVTFCELFIGMSVLAAMLAAYYCLPI